MRETLVRKFRTPTLMLLGLIGIDIGVRAMSDIWERHSPDDYAERVNGCAAARRDFVAVGGSTVGEGIIPEALSGFHWHGEGLTDGYAVGLPGATTSDVYHAVLRSCPTPPKLLVYGITASDINDSRHEPHGPHSLMAWSDLRTWVELRPESAEWVARHFVQGQLSRVWAAYHYQHGIRMWAAHNAAELVPGCCPDAAREAEELRNYSRNLRAGRGYAPAAGFVNTSYAEVKRVGGTSPPFAFLDKYRTGSHLKYLHRLLDWAAERGTAVVLVDMPITADLEAKYPAEFAEYRARLAELEANRGVRVIRTSRTAVGLDDSHFADVIHLNANGAKKLSAWLKDELDGIDTDRRSELHVHHDDRTEGVGP